MPDQRPRGAKRDHSNVFNGSSYNKIFIRCTCWIGGHHLHPQHAPCVCGTDLYDAASDQPIQCRALNIPEDLGQIGHVFSDKTGTLTENKMTFRYCCIKGRRYALLGSGSSAAPNEPVVFVRFTVLSCPSISLLSFLLDLPSIFPRSIFPRHFCLPVIVSVSISLSLSCCAVILLSSSPSLLWFVVAGVYLYLLLRLPPVHCVSLPDCVSLP